MKIARGLRELIREAGIIAVVVNHRREVLRALDPNRILFVG